MEKTKETLMCLGCECGVISHFGVSSRFFGELLTQFISKLSTPFVGKHSTWFIWRAFDTINQRAYDTIYQRVFDTIYQRVFDTIYQRVFDTIIWKFGATIQEILHCARTLKFSPTSELRIAQTSGLFLLCHESLRWTTSHCTSEIASRDRLNFHFGICDCIWVHS